MELFLDRAEICQGAISWGANAPVSSIYFMVHQVTDMVAAIIAIERSTLSTSKPGKDPPS